MPNFLAFFAPLTLFIPAVPGGPDSASPALLPEPEEKIEKRGQKVPPGWIIIDSGTAIPINHQVRIERRVTVRIAPRSTVQRRELVATLAPNAAGQQFIERDAGKCIPVKSIGAVQSTRNNRLLFYLRGGGMLAANLEKSCRSRDFYSGFYLEPNKDGKLCIKRDKLQSRTGAKCEISGLRQMVPVTPQ